MFNNVGNPDSEEDSQDKLSAGIVAYRPLPYKDVQWG